jgi:hypothetical protein
MYQPWRRTELYARIQRLEQVLLNSPHLTSYIRVVELPDLSSNFYTCEITTLPTMRKFTHVQKLKIRACIG